MTRRLALTVTVLAAALALGSADPASAVPVSCTDSVTDYCVEDEVVYPGTADTLPPTGQTEPSPDQVGVPTGDTGSAPRCTWVSNPGPFGSGDGGPGAFPNIRDRPATDAQLIFERCGDEYSGRVQWVTPARDDAATPPAVAPAPPAPEDLAATIRVRLEGNLPHPAATTSPASGRPAIVNHPTFLAIDNWTDTVTDQECALLLCVTVTATPTLTWAPGEPGAPTLTCTNAGTRYDPQGPSPHEQATAPNACAYAYQSRTGANGRPDQWPGIATVTWNLTWTSTTGAGGSLPAVVRTVDVPRAVYEVQAVVAR